LREGTCRIECASEQTAPMMLEEMFRLHTTRWNEQEEPGILGNTLSRAFHRQVVPQLVTQKLVRLHGLFLNDRMIAGIYNFVEASSVSLYLQAFDPEFAHLSPGSQIIGITIEDAIALRKDYVNFLRGCESYKYSWGAQDTPSFRISAHRVASSPGSVRRGVA